MKNHFFFSVITYNKVVYGNVCRVLWEKDVFCRLEKARESSNTEEVGKMLCYSTTTLENHPHKHTNFLPLFLPTLVRYVYAFSFSISRHPHSQSNSPRLLCEIRTPDIEYMAFISVDKTIDIVHKWMAIDMIYQDIKNKISLRFEWKFWKIRRYKQCFLSLDCCCCFHHRKTTTLLCCEWVRVSEEKGESEEEKKRQTMKFFMLTRLSSMLLYYSWFSFWS
jgi:hypothetical protein